MKLRLFFVICISLLATPVYASLEIFVCEPEWAALAQELGGDWVSTFSATTAMQDPHFIQARPSLIARIRRADLVVCTGANLEIGWLPVLLRQAANPRVAGGADGFFDASQFVRMRDVPAGADRAEGDIHPNGNPHFQTDPRTILPIAAALTERMVKIDPAGAERYRKGFEDFTGKWQAALGRWQSDAAPLRGMEIIVNHAAWVYMNDWLGLVEVGQMEPKPGLPPTPAHLSELLAIVKNHQVKAFIRTAYQSDKAGDWLSQRTGLPAVLIPHTVGATDGAKDLVGLYDDMIRRLLEVN